MSTNGNDRNTILGPAGPAEGNVEPGVAQGAGIEPEPPSKASPGFATRASNSGSEGLSKGKLLLLGGGLAVAVLFFIFTAIAGKAPKRQVAVKPQLQQQKQQGVSHHV